MAFPCPLNGGVIRSPLTTKSNIDTQNDAMFERKYVFLQGPSFWVSMLILEIYIHINKRGFI